MNRSKTHPPSVSKANDDAFNQLKSLLLTDDQQRIEALQAQIDLLEKKIAEKDQLINTLEPVVVELLRKKILESRPEMAEALAPVIGETIRRQIKNSREDVVDALYPLLGQMVTRSVAEAMKQLVKRVNETMERTFNIRGWFKQWKARRAGVSPGEMILAESAPFQLQGVYLIAKSSGLLIAHALREDDPQLEDNSQIIGGMLTAIKSFVETSFIRSDEEALEDINLENHKIRIQNGRYSYLAVVYTGIPSREFDAMLKECHVIIHKRFHQKLRNYDGNPEKLKGIKTPLLEIIRKMQAIEDD